MDYSQFLKMIPEAILMAILVIVFIADFASSKNTDRKWFNPLVCVLMLAQTIFCLIPMDTVTAFGGLYTTTPAANIMKAILAGGTLIVFIQSKAWMSRVETRRTEGEFYMLIISTLLGMYMMMSSGNFLMFFLGLEMASIPLACLVAFDKYRNDSAEGAAKFILTATFSSGVMLYGISFIYGAVGTLYFSDVAAKLTATPLTIMGMVFFFSGLGFKVSLVPFHFWTADTYQGAPTPITGYLSVISKGAAAFTLMIILMKVFAPLVQYWEYMLYIVIVLSITIANLFAIRQKEFKRFMAFSSISQAGYIMLAVVGNNSMGIAALVYYILIYVVANLAVFAIISVVEQKSNGLTDIDTYDGFYTTNPKLSFLMTLALFSLGGIPPFAGMFSKFFVFMAAAKEGSYLAYAVVFIALINTVISLYYYLLIVKAMYIKKSDNPMPTFKSDVNTKVALAICTIGIVAFGICSLFYNWISAGASL
jgi:NADH-quinone oxidoreductase subunit N